MALVVTCSGASSLCHCFDGKQRHEEGQSLARAPGCGRRASVQLWSAGLLPPRAAGGCALRCRVTCPGFSTWPKLLPHEVATGCQEEPSAPPTVTPRSTRGLTSGTWQTKTTRTSDHWSQESSSSPRSLPCRACPGGRGTSRSARPPRGPSRRDTGGITTPQGQHSHAGTSGHRPSASKRGQSRPGAGPTPGSGVLDVSLGDSKLSSPTARLGSPGQPLGPHSPTHPLRPGCGAPSCPRPLHDPPAPLRL